MKDTIEKLQKALDEAYINNIEEEAGGFDLCMAVSEAIGVLKAHKDFDFQRNTDEMVYLASMAGDLPQTLWMRLNERR